MVKSSSSSENEPRCSKGCKKNIDSLNSKITDLSEKLGDTKNMLYHYKLGLSQVEETRKKEKEGLESKLTGFKSTSKDMDNLLKSQRSDKNKEGLGYSDVPPPPAHVYSPLKKDMSWTGLPEFADDTITDYTRPSPSVESNPNDLQSNSSFASKNGESTGSIPSKPEIHFVRPADSPTVVKTDKKETVRKPTLKYVELYRKTSKRSMLGGNSKTKLEDTVRKKEAEVQNVKKWLVDGAFKSRNLIADESSSLGEDCWDQGTFNSRNLIADEASSLGKDTLKKEKEGLESKLTGFKSASKDMDNLLESQRSDKNKEGLGYSVVPPPPAQVYSPPKKDMSWTGLTKFADDTITNYTRPSPSVESNPNDLQNSSSSASENGESTGSILSKPKIKFMRPADSPTIVKTDKKETVRKPTVKYAELYRKTSKRSNVRGNQRNWNNLKS
nr:hypothetical protein [Tanacetum cinerariifolium]